MVGQAATLSRACRLNRCDETKPALAITSPSVIATGPTRRDGRLTGSSIRTRKSASPLRLTRRATSWAIRLCASRRDIYRSWLPMVGNLLGPMRHVYRPEPGLNCTEDISSTRGHAASITNAVVEKERTRELDSLR